MPNGYMGKILRVNLSSGQITTINTADYAAKWGGGYGVGAAIHWDLQSNWNADPHDASNIVSVMSNATGGTIAPGMGSRVEWNTSISPYVFNSEEDKPAPWFQRSGMGGRFGPAIKANGYDGIVIEGKASSPVWLSIVGGTATLRDATAEGDNLWGLDIYETQIEIWRLLNAEYGSGGERTQGQWVKIGDGLSCQLPAVAAIGPCGENKGGQAAIVHEGGNGGGCGGAAGVLGGKNLKAISAWGTQSVEIADPQLLMDTRIWGDRFHRYDVDNPPGTSGSRPGISYQYQHLRVSGCQACMKPCYIRHQNATFVDSRCNESYIYSDGNSMEVQMKATQWAQRMGVGGQDSNGKKNQRYLLSLYEMGILGPGKAIESYPVDFSMYGTLDWAHQMYHAIAYREGEIGDAVADGHVRAAWKFGRSAEDLSTGLVCSPQWGYMQHWTLPVVHWAYGNVVGERDINEHCISMSGSIPLDRLLELWSNYANMPGNFELWDFSWPGLTDADGNLVGGEGIYNRDMAKSIAWHRYWTRFWKESTGCCDFMYPKVHNNLAPDMKGYSPEMEVNSWNAITGQNITQADGVEIGRRIWNLSRSIWALQGRHADNEYHSAFYYNDGWRGERGSDEASGTALPYKKADGTWDRVRMRDMHFTRDGYETWRSYFYDETGASPTTGQPTRATLESVDLGDVADTLQSAGVLG